MRDVKCCEEGFQKPGFVILWKTRGKLSLFEEKRKHINP